MSQRKNLSLYCFTLPVLVATFAITLIARAQAAPSYTVAPFPVPDGYTRSDVISINNAGDAAGDLILANGSTKAFFYSDGVFHVIQQLEGYASTFVGGNYALNNRGLVTGAAIEERGSHEEDFAYQRDKRIPVGTAGINIGSTCVNDSNLIAGAQGSDLYLYQYPAGTTTLVPVPKNVDGLDVTGINIRGNVVGVTMNPNSFYGFFYGNGTVSFLPIPKGIKSVYPLAINSSNLIAGDLYPTSTGIPEAATYSNKKWTVLPMPSTVTLSTVRSMNLYGDVVGYFDSSAFTGSHAFVYTGGVFYDLNDLIDPSLGYILSFATSINAHGQIAVGYTTSGSTQMSAILSPS